MKYVCCPPQVIAHALYYADTSLQRMTQPAQEGMIEKQSSIVKKINSLASLLDSPCFSVRELNEYIKSFSPQSPQVRSRSRTLEEVIITMEFNHSFALPLYDQLITPPPPSICIYLCMFLCVCILRYTFGTVPMD